MTNVDSNGKPLDISSKIKTPDGKIANFQSRRNEAKIIGHAAKQSGDYEICFNNRSESLNGVKSSICD